MNDSTAFTIRGTLVERTGALPVDGSMEVQKVGETDPRARWYVPADELRAVEATQRCTMALACPWGCGHTTPAMWDFDWRDGVQITLCPGCNRAVDFTVTFSAARGSGEHT